MISDKSILREFGYSHNKIFFITTTYQTLTNSKHRTNKLQEQVIE